MLLNKKKNQVIKLDTNDNSILFVRVGDIVTDKDAKFEVPYSHNALLIKGGGDIRHYSSGTYDVFDNKAEVKNWKNGLSVEVVYIPKEARVSIEWGTPSQFIYRDKLSGKIIHMGAHGEFVVTVVNDEQFMRRVIGAKKVFDLEEFSEHFAAIVTDEFVDMFFKVVDELELPYDKFDANRKEIGTRVGKLLGSKLKEQYGVEVVSFTIGKFHHDAEQRVEGYIDEKLAEAKKREEKAENERLDDKQWEREKFKMMLGAQKDTTVQIARADAAASIASIERPRSMAAVFCTKCGNVCTKDEKFCPKCGAKLAKGPVKCPVCGKINDENSAYCSECGAKL